MSFKDLRRIEFVKLKRKVVLLTAGETLTRKTIDKEVRRRCKSFRLHADARSWRKLASETFRLRESYQMKYKRGNVR